MAAGVGGRLDRSDIVIHVHRHLGKVDGNPIVSFCPQNPSSDVVTASYVLRDFRATPDRVKTDLVRHRRTSVRWTFKDHPVAPCQEACESVTNMVMAAAVRDGPPYVVPTHLRAIADKAVAAGLIGHATSGSVSGVGFSSAGDDALTTAGCVGSPELVFHLSAQLSLVYDSTYVLVMRLQAEGWEWGRWIPPSSRKKKTAFIPSGYGLGEAKQ